MPLHPVGESGVRSLGESLWVKGLFGFTYPPELYKLVVTHKLQSYIFRGSQATSHLMFVHCGVVATLFLQFVGLIQFFHFQFDENVVVQVFCDI